MSTVNLQIDEVLKMQLNALMEQFESHRVFNNAPIFEKEVIKEEFVEIVKEEIVAVHKEETPVKEVIKPKEEKKESFFHKFFFSEY